MFHNTVIFSIWNLILCGMNFSETRRQVWAENWESYSIQSKSRGKWISNLNVFQAMLITSSESKRGEWKPISIYTIYILYVNQYRKFSRKYMIIFAFKLLYIIQDCLSISHTFPSFVCVLLIEHRNIYPKFPIQKIWSDRLDQGAFSFHWCKYSILIYRTISQWHLKVHWNLYLVLLSPIV